MYFRMDRNAGYWIISFFHCVYRHIKRLEYFSMLSTFMHNCSSLPLMMQKHFLLVLKKLLSSLCQIFLQNNLPLQISESLSEDYWQTCSGRFSSPLMTETFLKLLVHNFYSKKKSKRAWQAERDPLFTCDKLLRCNMSRTADTQHFHNKCNASCVWEFFNFHTVSLTEPTFDTLWDFVFFCQIVSLFFKRVHLKFQVGFQFSLVVLFYII